MKNSIKIFFPASLFLLILVSGLGGCRKFVQIPDAKNQIPTSDVFADSADATAAVLGLYINLVGNSGSSIFNFFHGGVTVYTGLSSDELISNTGNPDESAFYTDALSKDNYTCSFFWMYPYTTIYQANACIEGITASTGISTGWKGQLTGEAKFMRALTYFNLVNLFGDVPLITASDYKTSAVMPRTAKALVYAQVIRDLTDAQGSLSSGYVTGGRVRPNRFAATALLAKVYLYQQRWADAEAAASQVIASSNYSLTANLNDVFLAGSPEAILQLIPLVPGAETGEGNQFIPADPSVLPNFSISDFLLNAFEVNDQRKTSWLGKNVVMVNGVATDFYYPFKYQHGQDGLSVPKDDYMVLRLAEQYLIRAEARAQQSKTADAVADLNVIRARAGLPSYISTGNQADLLAAIYHERQIELFVEWGNRWYDLKRTDRANSVMNTVTSAKGGAWNANAQLYPIPFDQLKANPFLLQNPGY